MMRAARACATGLLLLLPALACAHGWGGKNTPLYDGILHVLLNPSFILPIAGVALLASRGGRELLALAQPAVLTMVLLGGALTGHELLGSEPPAGNPLWFCSGVVLGAMVLQGGVGGLTLLARAPWGTVAVRIAGSWIAAIGIIYAGFLFMQN
jgi:hypothetical protein